MSLGRAWWLQLGFIAATVMLFIFTLKFLFKLKKPSPKNRIRLNKKEHPELLEFIHRICKDTGAPKPRRIYIDPDVNAYVMYSNVWLSLFFPVRKDLTIGLGLVDCLNLTEFKAVIAHEFGHFAQRSMRIGSYILSANTIIHDMIYTRDKWDDILDQWRGTDLRLAIAAWVITPIIWLIRQILKLFYAFLNIMHSSLSREMEFNADKYAVQTAGSEAIVAALWRLDYGVHSWNKIVNNAYLATQKNVFTENLYRHNHLELERTKPLQAEHLNSLEDDELGGKLYFKGSAVSKVGMYASHPPNDQRERSAKTPFVKGNVDDRSPWLLFRKAEEIQKKMTLLVYEQYLSQKPDSFSEESNFEHFLAEESKGRELMEEYGNTFENRFFQIPSEEDVLPKDLDEVGISDVETKIKVFKNELQELSKPVHQVEQLMKTAQAIAQGTTTIRSFSYNGNNFNKKNLKQGYEILLEEREKLLKSHFKNWDKKFCLFHLKLATEKGQGGALRKLYNQHILLNGYYQRILEAKNKIYHEYGYLQSLAEVSEYQINSFQNLVINELKLLDEELEAFNETVFVPLPNIHSVKELKEALFSGGRVPQLFGRILQNGGFQRGINAIEQALSHCQRLDPKSIAAILSFHKELYNQ